MRPLHLLAATLVVAGLTVAVAAPSLHYDFVYDDEAVILERPPAWELGPRAFLESTPWVTGRHFTALSLDLDRLGTDAGQRPDPLPFHRTNIALAALLSLLVLAFGLRLGLGPVAATAAAALFAVHPTHVDAVVWIVGRAELLAALGVLGVLLIAIRPAVEADGPGDATADPSVTRPAGFWTVALASTLLATMAVHSKENALALPLLLVLARVILGSRVAWKPAMAGTSVALLTWLAVTGASMASVEKTQFVDNPLAYAPALERILKSLAILWEYIGLLFWPHPLLQDRSWAQTDPGLVQGWVATAAFAVLGAALWRRRRSAPLLVFAAAWIPAAFAITSNVVRPIGTLMAERHLLLPSVGACLLVGVALDSLGRSPMLRRTGLAACAAATAVLFVLFDARAAVWESGDTYFAASAAASPRSAKAQYDYGNWLLRHGRRVKAEAAYARALVIVPAFARAASRRAESMAKRGEPGDGADVYLGYLAVEPDDVGAIRNAVRLLLWADRAEEAVHWAGVLVDKAPDDLENVEALVMAHKALDRSRQSRPVAPGSSPSP